MRGKGLSCLCATSPHHPAWILTIIRVKRSSQGYRERNRPGLLFLSHVNVKTSTRCRREVDKFNILLACRVDKGSHDGDGCDFDPCGYSPAFDHHIDPRD